MNNKWSGDVDLGDGALQKIYKEYLDHLSFIRGLGLKDRGPSDKLDVDLNYLMGLVKEDIETTDIWT